MRLPEGVESIRAFARRVLRTHPTILQAIEEGRITAVYRDEAGQLRGVYWEQALAEYSANTDPTQAERTGASPLNTSFSAERLVGNASTKGPELIPREPAPAEVNESATNSGPQESRPAAPGPSGGEGDLFRAGAKDDHGYLEHRARTEEFKSKQAELEYLRDLGLLVSAADVREANFRRYRTLRDKLLNIPDRVATIVAAERDPARVHQVMTDELKRVLSELSSVATTEAAGGAAERVAA